MKCINKRICSLILCFVVMLGLTACGNTKYSLPYERTNETTSFNIVSHQSEALTLEPFASDLCIVSKDVHAGDLELATTTAGGLFDLNRKETLYCKNGNVTLHPASLTKLMTALVALENGTPDQVLTASENVLVMEPGAQVAGIKPGDKMTLDQALHILLIHSANDVAVMIAENVAGSEDEFCNLMNEEAVRIGATNSHFVNSHGLTADDHYVTAYDMYLIFNKAIQFSLITEILHMSSYTTNYYDSNGNEVPLDIETTNMYFRGNYEVPSNMTVLGGKTGTTNAAGHCLILYVKDSYGNPYISVIMNSGSRDELYNQMSDLLMEVKP